MKILRLSIYNIASLPDATIDFEHGALADNPIFLISGPTGAGKSTILNCICLALYNSCPSTFGNKKSDLDSDNFRLTDPVIMVRKGAANAEIQLEFIANNGRRYIALWAQRKRRQRRKKNGQMSELSYDNTRTLYDVAANASETFTTDKAVELTGLTYDEFTRTTLLAQGQFAQFLKAPGEEKAKMLEKITGTDVYTTIGQEIFRIFNEKESILAIKKLTVKELRTLSAEEIAQKEERIKELGTAIEKLEKLAADNEIVLNWLIRNKELYDLLAQYRNELAELQKTDLSPEVQKQRVDIQLFDSTVEVRATISERDNEEKQLGVHTLQHNTLIEKRLPQLLGAIVSLKDEIAKAETKKVELAEKVKADAPLAEALAQSETVKTLAGQVTTNLKEIAEKETALKSLSDKRLTLSETEKTTAEAAKAASEEMERAEGVVKEFDKKKEQIDLKALNEAVEAPSAQLRHIAEAESAMSALTTALEDKKKAEADCAELQSSINQSDKELDELQQQRPTLEVDFQAKNKTCDALSSIEEKIDEIRAGLEATHTCPVCGTQGVQFVGAQALSAEVEKARAERDAAKKLLDDCDSKISASKSAKTATEKILTSSKMQLDTKTVKCNKLQADFDAKFADVDLRDDQALQALKDRLTEQVEVAKKALSAASELINEADKAQKAFQKSVSDHTKAQSAHNEAFKVLNNNTQEQSAVKSAITLLRQKISEAMAEANAILPSEYHAEESDIKEISSRFCARAAAYLKAITEIERLEKSIGEMKQQRSTVHTQLLPIIDSETPAEASATGINPNLTADVAVFVSEISAAKALISNAKDKVKRLQLRIDSYFAQHPHLSMEILSLLNANAEQINELRQKFKTHDDALLESRAKEEAIKTQLAQHQESRPEMEQDATQEVVAQRIEATKADLDRNKAEIAQVRTELETDAKMRSEAADRLIEIEQLEIELAKWKELNEHLGTRSNPRFRPIAQSYVLRSLLFKANHYLSRFSKRYTLTARPGTLTISVVDSDMPGTPRASTSLSGGESFLVSLALALALASISKEKINVDTLFIDEGFGSLDSESLSMVIDALDSLYTISHRRIGIISHVEILKERIATQIRLTPCGSNTSKVEVIG